MPQFPQTMHFGNKTPKIHGKIPIITHFYENLQALSLAKDQNLGLLRYTPSKFTGNFIISIRSSGTLMMFYPYRNTTVHACTTTVPYSP